MTKDQTPSREEVIAWARDCRLPSDELYHPNLERFAALVAAAEREAILQMSRDQWFKTQADFDEAIRARGQK